MVSDNNKPASVVHPDNESPAPASMEEVIEDPNRIRKIVTFLIAYQAKGFVRVGHTGIWPVRMTELKPQEPYPVHWQLKERCPTPPFVIEVTGYNSVYLLSITGARKNSGHLVTDYPKEIIRIRHRWERRVPAPLGLLVSFLHPEHQGLRLYRRLHDLCINGISFWSFPQEDRIEEGLTAKDLDVVYNGAVIFSGTGTIRHMSILPSFSSDAHGLEATCGMQLMPRSSDDASRWLNLVTKVLSPNTRSGATWGKQSWKVYEDSGFFNLSGKAPTDFNALKKSFTKISSRLDASPRIGCQTVWPSSRGIEATFTHIKPYSGTWFGYQLAKNPDKTSLVGISSRKILRDIYLYSHEYAQFDPQCHWIAGYMEANVRWTQISHFEFARKYTATNQGLLLPFRLMESTCKNLPGLRDKKFDIGPATEEECDLLLKVIAGSMPKPYVEALDLVPGRFDPKQVKEEWAWADLSRDRVVLTARLSGRPLAAAIAEIGETGMSLFRLLDSVRIFPLSDGGEQAYPSLIEEVRQWYRARNKDSFIFFLESWKLESALKAGLNDLGKGILWILSHDIHPDFLEYVYELLAPKIKDG